MPLIRRDSDASPFKTNQTNAERIRANWISGKKRAEYLHQQITQNQEAHPTSASNQFINLENGYLDFGLYYIKIYVSSKRQTQWLQYDTGSSLTWLQCKNCNPCYEQPNRPYDITKSSSATLVSCSRCKSSTLTGISTSCKKHKCSFSQSYVDGSGVAGILAKETFNFGDARYFKNVVFGCATSSKYMLIMPDGIAGFSMKPASLPSQLAPQLGRNAFSSCLIRNDLNGGNKLTLGPKAIAPPGISYTPLVNPKRNGKPPTHYNLEVTKVLIGNKVLSIPFYAFNSGSGTIIDSGTTLTLLHQKAADPILIELHRVVKSLTTVFNMFSPLCYALSVSDSLELNKHFPQITFVFKGNVKVKLLGYQYMYIYDENTVCCSIDYSGAPINILGFYFQQDYLVVHDVDKQRVGFKPMNCATGRPR